MISVTPRITTIASPSLRMMNPVIPDSFPSRAHPGMPDYFVKYQSSGFM